ncbi:MAG: AMP-binding protein [Streptococcus sp.]|nr:AMP-binding protein [Streptococcus sp.]
MYQRIKKWALFSPNKIAITDGEQSLTYLELIKFLDKNRSNQEKSPIIHEYSPFQQLLSFLIAFKKNNCPLIIHPNLTKNEIIQIKQITSNKPKTADFGILSSGTTNTPKIYWRTFDSWKHFFPIQTETFSISSQTTLFLVGSFSFTGNLNMALSQLYSGGTIVVTNHKSIKNWKKLCSKFQVTHLYLLPIYLSIFSKYINKDFKTINHIITSSQFLEKETIQILYKKIPDVSFIVFYGASEVSFLTWCYAYELLKEPFFVGQPFPNVELFIRDNKIMVQTPYTILGIKCPYTVNDYGKLNKKGLFLLGRDQDWVNQYGIQIHLPTLLNIIKDLPFVSNACALKENGNQSREFYSLFLILSSNNQATKVITSIKDKLSPSQHPKQIVILNQFPLNDSGKIDIQKLKYMKSKKTESKNSANS